MSATGTAEVTAVYPEYATMLDETGRTLRIELNTFIDGWLPCWDLARNLQPGDKVRFTAESYESMNSSPRGVTEVELVRRNPDRTVIEERGVVLTFSHRERSYALDCPRFGRMSFLPRHVNSVVGNLAPGEPVVLRVSVPYAWFREEAVRKLEKPGLPSLGGSEFGYQFPPGVVDAAGAVPWQPYPPPFPPIHQQWDGHRDRYTSHDSGVARNLIPLIGPEAAPGYFGYSHSDRMNRASCSSSAESGFEGSPTDDDPVSPHEYHGGFYDAHLQSSTFDDTGSVVSESHQKGDRWGPTNFEDPSGATTDHRSKPTPSSEDVILLSVMPEYFVQSAIEHTGYLQDFNPSRNQNRIYCPQLGRDFAVEHDALEASYRRVSVESMDGLPVLFRAFQTRAQFAQSLSSFGEAGRGEGVGLKHHGSAAALQSDGHLSNLSGAAQRGIAGRTRISQSVHARRQKTHSPPRYTVLHALPREEGKGRVLRVWSGEENNPGARGPPVRGVIESHRHRLVQVSERALQQGTASGPSYGSYGPSYGSYGPGYGSYGTSCGRYDGDRGSSVNSARESHSIGARKADVSDSSVFVNPGSTGRVRLVDLEGCSVSYVVMPFLKSKLYEWKAVSVLPS